MSTPRIGKSNPSVTVDQTRPRETPRPAVTFASVLRGGAAVLASGARAAATVVGGPMLSAAVAGARAGADVTGASGLLKGASGAGSDQGDALKALQEQKVSDDLKLLALQSEIQRHDRQIQLVSNMMKARHDTAKAAIGNIRS